MSKNSCNGENGGFGEIMPNPPQVAKSCSHFRREFGKTNTKLKKILHLHLIKSSLFVRNGKLSSYMYTYIFAFSICNFKIFVVTSTHKKRSCVKNLCGIKGKND